MTRPAQPRPPLAAAMVCLFMACAAGAEEKPADVTFAQRDGQVDVLVGGRVVATYVYADARTHRPYFKDVRTPSGIQVTRNHPPIDGKDRTDHPDMHPGLWLAFGDVGGEDFWRNKGPRVEHERFAQPPRGGDDGRGTFEVVNRYVADGRTLCRETTRYTVIARPAGYLLVWDSSFTPEGDGGFDFGEQEEMGLGVRVATPLAVKGGSGAIRNSRGGLNEKGTWGQPADWCDYAGTVGGRHVGVTLMVPPGGATKPWFHSRDYGLLVANPFGPRAGAPARFPVPPGATFRLRLAVFVHESERAGGVDVGAEYQQLVKQLEAEVHDRRASANGDGIRAAGELARRLYGGGRSAGPGICSPLLFFVARFSIAGYFGIPMESQRNSRAASG